MNMEKICSKCQTSKPLEEFAKDSRGKLGRRSDCKICNCKSSCERQKKNMDKVLIKNALWRKKNSKHYQNWRISHAPRARELARLRYDNRPEVRQERVESARAYRANPDNKPIIRATQNKLNKKYRQNPQWRALANLRRRLSFVLAGARKAAHSIELLGCTKEALEAHLERQFTQDMTWDNYGVKGWHIDHKKPCAAFDLTDPAQQRECFHFSNLQPLWAKENLEKGDSYQ